MTKEMIIFQSIYAAIVTGALGLLFWQIKKLVVKVDNVETNIEKLRYTIVDEYVRKLEKEISENEKQITECKTKIDNLERAVFENKDRRVK